jgi:trehalose/maltose hydrolase-like predicted phosphorylase
MANARPRWLVVPVIDAVLKSAGLTSWFRVRRRHTQRPPSVWSLVYDGFDSARQGLREALYALGSGYFVTRGALPEAEADRINYPGTYVAGVYNRLVSVVAEREVENGAERSN